MSQETKKYWKSFDELNNSDAFVAEKAKEFSEELPLEEIFSENKMQFQTGRRDFLKMFGFSIAAATLAACNKTPVKKAIPFLSHPEVMSPSIPTYYASSYYDGVDYASVLVKTREGRPIKIEPNNLSKITGHGLHARVNASLLNLYDGEREKIKSPMVDGNTSTWSDLDSKFKAGLDGLKATGGAIRVVTPTVISPSQQSLINKFVAAYPSAKHIQYDSISNSGIIEAHNAIFGVKNIPNMHFGDAKVIVSLDADFLGNWILPTTFTTAYAANRKVNADKMSMSRHYHFEPTLSLTGSNADYRATYKPSDAGQVVAKLYNEVAGLLGKETVSAAGKDVAGNLVKKSAAELVNAKGASLVISGSNDKNVQALVCGINLMLENYGKTLDIANPIKISQGVDSEFNAFVEELKSGSVQAVIMANVNPVYSHPQGKAIAASLAKIALNLSLTESLNETSESAKYIAPSNHYLENWGDLEPIKGSYSLVQPAITKIFDTRSIEECMMSWLGLGMDYYEFVKNNWQSTLYSTQNRFLTFSDFWRQALQDGVYTTNTGSVTAPNANFSASSYNVASGSAENAIDLVIYQKIGLGDGSMSNNPWLQELPDPITRVCWDNYLIVNPHYASKNGIKDGLIVKVEANGYSVEVPALVLPGLMPNTVALALGYGRSVSGNVALGLGKNAAPFKSLVNGNIANYATGVTITKTSNISKLAQTQTHHTIEGRNIVKETSLAEYTKYKQEGKPEKYNLRPTLLIKDAKGNHVKANPYDQTVTLWDKRTYEGHHWVMAIDLNACTGCGSCVVACQTENNVPVVGKQEVINRREMHWMRIDRYFSFKAKDGSAVTKETEYGMEGYASIDNAETNKVDDFSNVEVVYQPVMCQQCDSAPCETVCPVLATVHSDEGLNQMVYNRCVGTRYCANNCPYKVRRFNWFSYIDNPLFTANNPAQSDLGKMVLNPDVTVRARGVMEKCSFCVQSIQAAKLTAKKENRGMNDGDVTTACQRSCPTNAIVFGDFNDEKSEVRKLYTDDRAYGLVEEIQTLPSVRYLTKVRNKDINSNNA